jgi:hypothetical protein
MNPIARDGNGIFKTATACLASALLTGVISYFTMGRNNVTKEDLEKQLPSLIMQNNPYVQDARNISTQLQALHEEQVRQGSRMDQIATDVARISEKVGVSAHPRDDR